MTQSIHITAAQRAQICSVLQIAKNYLERPVELSRFDEDSGVYVRDPEEDKDGGASLRESLQVFFFRGLDDIFRGRSAVSAYGGLNVMIDPRTDEQKHLTQRGATVSVTGDARAAHAALALAAVLAGRATDAAASTRIAKREVQEMAEEAAAEGLDPVPVVEGDIENRAREIQTSGHADILGCFRFCDQLEMAL